MNKKGWEKSGSAVDFNTWYSINSRVNELIGETVITQPEGVCLPMKMGLLLTIKRKPRNTVKHKNNIPFYDLKRFAQTGEKVPQLNLHTFGHYYTIRWIPQNNTRFSLREIYSFKAVRQVNRGLADKIRSGYDFLVEKYQREFCNLC